MERGDLEPAIDLYRSALNDLSWSAVLGSGGRWESLGFVLGQAELFIVRLEALPSPSPSQDVEAGFLLARLWARFSVVSASDRAKAHQRAEERLRTVLIRKIDFARGYALWAWLHEQGGRSAEAVEAWRAAYVLDPEQPAFELGLALALTSARRFREAVPLFANIAARAPSAEAFTNLGLALRESGELEHALVAFEKATAKDPRLARPWVETAICLRALGRSQEALQAFETAIEIDPARPEAFIHRSRLYLRLQRIQEARTDFNRASKLYPTHREVQRLGRELSWVRGEDEDTLAPVAVAAPALQMALSSFGVAEVVEFLSMTRRTGFLELPTGHFELVEGRILAAGFDGGPSFAERVPNLPTDLSARLMARGGRLFRVLQVGGLDSLDETVIAEAAHQSAIDAALHLLECNEGTLSFVDQPLDEDALHRARAWSSDAQAILLEAFRQLDEARASELTRPA